ncbi:MAG: pilus assembly protein N-terminal domain-containing protein, partial [Acidobacteria bacterium]|nr:pilus assembly protein N-terminal domain-containing protein [Acidobacteriota bacterium]
AISPKEVLVNGKAPGETSLVIWQEGGSRLFYDLKVLQSTVRIEAARAELTRELPGQAVTVNFENDTAFLGGTVKDVISADRAVSIAGTLGKVVNLLHVMIPPVEAQILLKVRFANVDRAALQDLGANLYSTGALNTPGAISTGQFSPSRVAVADGKTEFSLGDALNLFLFRPDLNLAATIRALQTKMLLEILAEPNLLTINGKPASFVAGGEFPFPTLQGGGAGLGAVTIAFREFGVRINFLPTVTPRGTIRLQVVPEVSSLDYANGLVFQGFNIPALSTRRVQTEVELEDGQSFVIGGLLDNRTTESLNKIPGLADIPLLGKLFQSRSINKNHTELLVLITPELVRPIPAGQRLPDVERPLPFMREGTQVPPRTPGMQVTGAVPVTPPQETVPVEQLMQEQKASQGTAAPVAPVQYVPVPMMGPAQAAPVNPGLTSPIPTLGSGAGK